MGGVTGMVCILYGLRAKFLSAGAVGERLVVLLVGANLNVINSKPEN